MINIRLYAISDDNPRRKNGFLLFFCYLFVVLVFPGKTSGRVYFTFKGYLAAIHALLLTANSTCKTIAGLHFGGVPEWSKGSDCKSDGSAFGGSNPPPSTR
jgi:hypothetical protein